MSSMELEKYTNSAREKEFAELETSSFAEVARALLVGFGTMLLLGVGTYMVVFALSAVLAALLS